MVVKWLSMCLSQRAGIRKGMKNFEYSRWVSRWMTISMPLLLVAIFLSVLGWNTITILKKLFLCHFIVKDPFLIICGISNMVYEKNPAIKFIMSWRIKLKVFLCKQCKHKLKFKKMKQSHIWYFTDRIKEKQKVKFLMLNSKQNEWYRIDCINAFSKLSLLSEGEYCQ